MNEIESLCKALSFEGRVNSLRNALDVTSHLSEDGSHSILASNKEDRDAIVSKAVELGLDVSVEEVPFTLTVIYFKISIKGIAL